MQLSPREYFTVARGLEDHTDSTPYYVRATVRNARTDVLLDTLDLVDQGDGHRFSKAYQIPADPSGQGFYILITTSVYTDAGYTTKSQNYGDKYDTYLVADRVNANLHGGGAGGPDIDYKKIQKIVAEEIKKVPQQEKIEIPEVDLAPLTEEVRKVGEKVSGITIPTPEKVNFSPILEAISAIPSKIDHNDILSLLSEIKGKVESVESKEYKVDLVDVENQKQQLGELLQNLKNFFSGDIEKISNLIDEIKKKLDTITFVAIPENKVPENNPDEIKTNLDL